MIAVFSLLFLSLCVRLSAADEKMLLKDWDYIIDEINQGDYTWKAGQNFPSNTPLSKLRKMVGSRRDPPASTEMGVIKRLKDDDDDDYYDDDDTSDIPDSFDAREQWSQCPSIGTISDTSACGSAWAVAPADAMTDRICITSNGQNQLRISASYIMSCCTQCGTGCGGGWAVMSYGFWCRWGAPSGGAYGSNLGCQNYPLEPCDHYDSGGSHAACPEENYEIGQCSLTCDDGASSVNETISYGRDFTFLDWEVSSVQREIMANGSVTADFDLYTDFYYYKEGIYKHQHGHMEGTHTMRLIGWGSEFNATSNVTTDYWIGANSWNEDWGDQGFVKFYRGSDHLGIESWVSVGFPANT